MRKICLKTAFLDFQHSETYFELNVIKSEYK